MRYLCSVALISLLSCGVAQAQDRGITPEQLKALALAERLQGQINAVGDDSPAGAPKTITSAAQYLVQSARGAGSGMPANNAFPPQVGQEMTLQALQDAIRAMLGVDSSGAFEDLNTYPDLASLRIEAGMMEAAMKNHRDIEAMLFNILGIDGGPEGEGRSASSRLQGKVQEELLAAIAKAAAGTDQRTQMLRELQQPETEEAAANRETASRNRTQIVEQARRAEQERARVEAARLEKQKKEQKLEEMRRRLEQLNLEQAKKFAEQDERRLEAAALKAAAGAAANHPPSRPSIWPAWIGAVPAYAAAYSEIVPARNAGFKAEYSGEARGMDGEGNVLEGGLLIRFNGGDGDVVHMEGDLMGLEFMSSIAGPANGFSANLGPGTLDLSRGTEEYYAGGSMDGKFYGAGHENVGGTFSLIGKTTSDVAGHFAGAEQ